MNNALNAKLSKLIYALASDDPEYLSKAGAFDRLLLLVRELYRMLDETEGLKQLVFRLYYGKHYGLIKLDAASPNDDAGALRLKRWMVYSRIAERNAKIAASICRLCLRMWCWKMARTNLII